MSCFIVSVQELVIVVMSLNQNKDYMMVLITNAYNINKFW